MLTTTRRRRLRALALLPLLLLLAGCGRFTADIEIRDVDTLHVSYDMGIDSSLMQDVYGSAEEMCADTGADGVYNEVQPEPYEEDGLWGCRATGAADVADFGGDLQLTEQDGEFHLVMDTGDAAPVSTSDLALLGFDDFELRLSFTFPGAIIESSGGQIDGNTVTYTSLSEVTSGIDIRAEAGGFPWLIIVVVVLVLGFLLLLALAVVGFVIYRARKGRSSGPGSGTGAPAAFAAAGSAAAPPAPQDQQSQQWGQAPPPPAAPQSGQGQQFGQASPPPASQGEQWSPSGQQGHQDQPWTQDPHQDQQGLQEQQGRQDQPWSQDPNQQDQQGWNQQPPQNPGW